MMKGKFTQSEADAPVPVLKCSCEEPLRHRITDLSPTAHTGPKQNQTTLKSRLKEASLCPICLGIPR